MPKSTHSVEISIPQPCDEAWEEMSPDEQGQFCGSCQKVVIDFSSMSDAELLAALRNPNAGCGRFRTDQLNRAIIIDRQSSLRGGKWIALAATMAGVLSGFAKESSARNYSTTYCESIGNEGGVLEKNKVVGTGGELFGQVLESKTHEPAVGANLELILNNEIIASTSTDIDGRFLFLNVPIPAHSEMLLRVSYMDTSVERLITSAESATNIRIYVMVPIEPINDFVVRTGAYRRSINSMRGMERLPNPTAVSRPPNKRPLLHRLQFWRRRH